MHWNQNPEAVHGPKAWRTKRRKYQGRIFELRCSSGGPVASDRYWEKQMAIYHYSMTGEPPRRPKCRGCDRLSGCKPDHE